MAHFRTAAVLTIVAASLAAAPASQPASDYPAMRKRMAELTTLVEQLKADVDRLTKENARLADQVATLTPKPTAGDNVRPTSTFTSRTEYYLSFKKLEEIKELSKAERDEKLRHAKDLDSQIDSSGLDSKVRTALHEGKISIGASRAIVTAIAATGFANVVESATAYTADCQVWGPGLGSSMSIYRVTFQDDVVCLVSDR